MSEGARSAGAGGLAGQHVPPARGLWGEGVVSGDGEGTPAPQHRLETGGEKLAPATG